MKKRQPRINLGYQKSRIKRSHVFYIPAGIALLRCTGRLWPQWNPATLSY